MRTLPVSLTHPAAVVPFLLDDDAPADAPELPAFDPGDRVETHPGTDTWVRGDRYGTVVRTLRTGRVLVTLDRSGHTLRFHPSRILPVD